MQKKESKVKSIKAKAGGPNSGYQTEIHEKEHRTGGQVRQK